MRIPAANRIFPSKLRQLRMVSILKALRDIAIPQSPREDWIMLSHLKQLYTTARPAANDAANDNRPIPPRLSRSGAVQI